MKNATQNERACVSGGGFFEYVREGVSQTNLVHTAPYRSAPGTHGSEVNKWENRNIF